MLDTPRLRLRELAPHDLDFVAAMLSDPEVMRFYPKRLTREEAAVWIERQRGRYASGGHGLWLAQRRENDQPVGQVGLTIQAVGDRSEPEVGYLIHRPWWRRGYASEAAAAVLDHAFDTLGKPRVVSLIRPDNTPSQGVAIKIGMTLVGEADHAGLPHLVYAVSMERARGPGPAD